MSDPSPIETQRWRRIDIAMLSLVMLLALGARLLTIDRPFHRDPEGCGAFYGTLARNYFRYGLTEHFAVPIQSIGVTNDAPVFYPNHPPLLPLLIAGTYGVFGWNPTNGDFPADWQTRLPTTFFTLACPALIFMLLRSRASLRAATFASILFSLVPMTIVFGSQPDVINTQLVFFAMLTVVAYLHFHETPSVKSLALLSLTFAPAAATDWPAFHLVPVLGIHYIATRPVRRWGWIVAFGVIAIAIFALLYVQVVAVTHDWRWMGRLVARRAASSVADNDDRITLAKWLYAAIWNHAVGRHTIFVSSLMLVWIALVASMRSLRESRSTILIALLLCWTALHVAIGRQGVYVHEWWWWPLTGGAVMSAGVALDAVIRLIRSEHIRRIATILTSIALAGFGAFNFSRATKELLHPYSITTNTALDYTVIEMGAAIRAAAPPNHAVMLAESDDTLGLWFYADRPIKRNVWDPQTFESRLRDGVCDLQFQLTEPWSQPPAAMVIPKAYVSSNLQPFIDYLDVLYPRRETDKFITYTLQQN